MRVYLAASSTSIDELNHHADSLRWAGHAVKVGEPGDGVDTSNAVSWSDVVVFLSSEDDSAAGANTQDDDVGLAVERGKRVFLVGPRRTADRLRGEVRHFPRWGRCVLEALEDLW